jgi:nitroreductase
MNKAFDLINRRISVRSYSDRAVDKNLRDELIRMCANPGRGPFGASVRFNLLDMDPLGKAELKLLGTYGVIKGARLYILAAVEDGPGALDDTGYLLEKIILRATAAGLGTCWLAGTFKRAAFASRMNLSPGEMLPAITPAGYPANQISATDSLMRFSARSSKRKPREELFFAGDGSTPLTVKDMGGYRDALEAVRLGPSASNKQPWRIIMPEPGIFTLYLKENIIYNRIMGKIRIQRLDMGIAMCHFELVAHDQGLSGAWRTDLPAKSLPGLTHIATWSSGV